MDKPNSISLHYDKEGDVLYIYFDKPREAVCIEEDEGALIRVDPETLEVVGFTIIDFLRRFNQGTEPNLHLPLLVASETVDFKQDAAEALERLYEKCDFHSSQKLHRGNCSAGSKKPSFVL